jgi:tRNA(adenine34) deaminase
LAADPLAPARAEDVLWMARALEQARAAEALGEVPIGAVLVHQGRLLAEGHNLTVTTHDPTSHAEVVTLRRGSARIGDFRLIETTLYVTLEPCAMCCGALVLGRVPRIVFGAPDPKAGMAGSLGNLLQDSRLNHRAELTSGVLAGSAGDMLRGFFRARRGK